VSPLIVTAGNDVVGHEIVQYLDIVRGIVVRSTEVLAYGTAVKLQKF